MIWSLICSRCKALGLASFYLLSFSVAAANAEESNPAGMEPSNANATDRVFVDAMARGGIAEVTLARLARERSKTDLVDDFAEKMIDDHGDANTKLAALAKNANIPLPDKMDPEHQDISDQLAKLSGPQLDIRYLTIQIADHQKAVLLLSHEIGAGQHKGLQGFAKVTLPTVLMHLQLCQSLLERLLRAAKP